MKILAFESSCDETAVSIVENGLILSNIVSTQLVHSKFGGVIPEIAARTHLKDIFKLTQISLKEAATSIKDINYLAVTTSPGLVGSLLVGSNFAKGLAIKYNLPIIPINHIEGHLYSGNLQDNSLKFPLISLVVSGGHTSIFLVNSYNNYEILGSTIDDAAGEAFDKIAKMLGLPYPGGAKLDELAKLGNSNKFDFPRSMIHSKDYNFSFSGLKTSVRYFLQKEYNLDPNKFHNDLNDICASAQEAIVDVLVHKTIKACINNKVKHLTISGGVSANSLLRSSILESAKKHNIKVVIPDLGYCIDNAAMIGFLAYQKIIDINKEKKENLHKNYLNKPNSNETKENFNENIEKNDFYNLSFNVSSNHIRANRT
jgi:N6-L-threonylcarbamoyladenine synthase